jgi:hypothetical protein
MRAVLGIVAGLVVAYIVLILIGLVGVGATYSVPRGTDLYDGRAVMDLLLAMPAAPKIALLVALFGGTLIGAALAKLISRRAWAAWAVAISYTILGALSVLPLPIAGWMQAVTIAVPVVAGLFANHLVKSSGPIPDPDPAADI